MKTHRTQKSTDAFVAGGTHLQGHIVTTRSKIESVFGVPTYDVKSFDEKVTTEWVIVFDTEDEDSIVATIYDWKRYELGKPAMDETIVWNVGGLTYEAVTMIEKQLGVNASKSYPFGIAL